MGTQETAEKPAQSAPQRLAPRASAPRVVRSVVQSPVQPAVQSFMRSKLRQPKVRFARNNDAAWYEAVVVSKAPASEILASLAKPFSEAETPEEVPWSREQREEEVILRNLRGSPTCSVA